MTRKSHARQSDIVAPFCLFGESASRRAVTKQAAARVAKKATIVQKPSQCLSELVRQTCAGGRGSVTIVGGPRERDNRGAKAI